MSGWLDDISSPRPHDHREYKTHKPAIPISPRNSTMSIGLNKLPGVCALRQLRRPLPGCGCWCAGTSAVVQHIGCNSVARCSLPRISNLLELSDIFKLGYTAALTNMSHHSCSCQCRTVNTDAISERIYSVYRKAKKHIDYQLCISSHHRENKDESCHRCRENNKRDMFQFPH
ncbi:hypothetical protein CBL_01267 [Carabus blaptoides fortunei]